jgi:hypothetical protein
VDWSWILSRVDQKINLWCNRWISRGGRLVLIKSFIEAIPVYWHLLALISKGILCPIMNLYFNYLWKGSMEYQGLHLANRRSLSKPKCMGGWGLKDGSVFGCALATKSMWVLLMQDSLWRRILIDKYISLASIVD